MQIKDPDAESVVLIVKETAEDAVAALTATAAFTDGVADLTDIVDLPVGEYVYQINIEYPGGDVDKYPDPEQEDCDGDECSFGEFVVCASLDSEVS